MQNALFSWLLVLSRQCVFCKKIISLSGISDIKIGQKSGNFDSNIALKGDKSYTDFFQKDGIGFF